MELPMFPRQPLPRLLRFLSNTRNTSLLRNIRRERVDKYPYGCGQTRSKEKPHHTRRVDEVDTAARILAACVAGVARCASGIAGATGIGLRVDSENEEPWSSLEWCVMERR